ncbi:MarR family winged helix-turn-helix transcriptional regulator [Rhizobium fabae]|uniref:MarR family transcriptional regulator n=1 Tax=Rhizobium fabae TaxID=573179 RepID=A0A7W6FMS8_9HYPH|nr:MarR family transcriptional regulator [Rhizobium fabae]MBB3919507.1 DNA-binding MarR family transcriptional regulator [Rhizobium fabae]RUM06262.1 MarR family transcriptional regulator [Rhizobium fabae]
MTPKTKEEIVQQPISKKRLRLWLRLLKATRYVEDEVRRRLRSEFTSTLPRFDVMSALSRSPEGLKMNEISKRLQVSNGNITGIVDKLTEEGLVLRITPPGDRRSQIIRLTLKGQKEFERNARAHEAWIDEIFGGLNEDDVDGMIFRLEHLTDKLDEHGEGG